ncbi:MAG: RHS repeat-associated core domain-containing protein [Candidatus Izimaplasma sp.]|nr:RHS repeat-associated core domain-containing protein [Candidatus Izimaplasma bacterium]
MDQLESYDIIVDCNTITQEIISYDGQGNPTEITNFVYTDISGTENFYDHANFTWEGRSLISITIIKTDQSTKATITYAYNDKGYRTSKTITEGATSEVTTYDLLNDKVIHESDGTSNIYYTYDSNGSIISMNKNGTDYFYLHNLQGDVIGLVDDYGSTVVNYTYDAYGNISMSTVNDNSYTYRGYRYDSEINMYYLNSRYYNPEIGRFLNSDGIIGDLGGILSTNMYAYCQNNPILYDDPTGFYIRNVTLYETDGHYVYNREYFGAAQEYKNFDKIGTGPNCYGYAIGYYDITKKLQPGETTNISLSTTNEKSYISSIEVAMKADFTYWGRNIRNITGPYSDIGENEYRIALRVTSANNAKFYGQYDYHFMVQTSAGTWASKSGFDPSIELYSWLTPKSSNAWNEKYDGEIRYYAITLP